MSSVGLDWYKREPQAWLADTQGLSAKEHAVYSVVVELLYVHGGSISNDPGWISGWISDMGAAAVRNTLISLAARKKISLIITDEEISQKRAKNEAKTKRKQSENNSKNGRIGGVSSGKSRSQNKENNDLGEANASSETQAEKRREEIDKDTSVSLFPETEKPPPKRKSRIPENAAISDAMLAAAERRGHGSVEAEAQFAKFKNDALAKGKTFLDWDRAFVTWLDSEYFRPITSTGGQPHASVGTRRSESVAVAADAVAAQLRQSRS